MYTYYTYFTNIYLNDKAFINVGCTIYNSRNSLSSNTTYIGSYALSPNLTSSFPSSLTL